MSSYATVEELTSRLSDLYGGLYKDRQGAEMEREAQSDLDSAEAEINGLIGTRFRVPVTAAGSLPLLRHWTLTLAEELAWSRSGKGKLPESLANRVKQVREYLEKIANGTMTLAGAEQDEESGGGSIAFFDGNEPVFGRENMKGY